MGNLESNGAENVPEGVDASGASDKEEGFMDKLFAGADDMHSEFEGFLEAMATMDEKIKRLEKSDIGMEMAFLMHFWIKGHIADPDSYKQYVSERKENGNVITFRELIMTMVNTFLSTRPDLKAKVNENPGEKLPKLVDEMFEVLFAWAPTQFASEKRSESVVEVEGEFNEIWFSE
ncbi:hypothetical protein HOG48_00525 [Candidatus Peregrinibacteria bacterium]|jgi:hypothetical protein|nr:hypothetical protein [Candidatus Peregrinibacteria bacterium]